MRLLRGITNQYLSKTSAAKIRRFVADGTMYRFEATHPVTCKSYLNFYNTIEIRLNIISPSSSLSTCNPALTGQ